MLKFKFSGLHVLHTCPEPLLRIERGTIRRPNGDVVAEHRGGYWHVDGLVFTAIECNAPLFIQLQTGARKSPSVGPFEDFRVASRHLSANNDVMKFRAAFDQSDEMWHFDGKGWETVIISSEPF